MASIECSVFLIFVTIFIISSATHSTTDLKIRTENDSENSSKLSPKTTVLLLRSIQNEPVIYGFRAESSKYPVIIDENGLTVIPDKVLITLRLFGNNLFIAQNSNRKIRIGFTTKSGTGGESCSPDTNEFTVHPIINNNMALVDIKLSETIRDDPYYLCYGFTQSVNSYDGLKAYSGTELSQLFSPKTTKYLYLSSDQSMKLRVIGRELAVKYRSKNENRDANIRSKLVQIMDEVNKIHRLTDDMQDW